ncbi:hypothetical protein N7495_004045 [Penicillium taxi]|uniref:uncharacterized protein n=1 Tax=Penicillium taxi TaxID=168475 RepID=UPI002544F4BC|nr:uncharacterized protein N7495_004045 [Penicillium taxi]KAJ5899301.1 hypothetical protein N7495_004045 [Penicillium taxi]
MATTKDVEPVFYPAFCFQASPTYFTWVKMSVADVHQLQRPIQFEGQNLFFFKNHPIRYVSVLGMIVARSEVYRRTILTIDDSTGATINVIVLHAEVKEKEKQTTGFVQPVIAQDETKFYTAEPSAEGIPNNLPGQTTHITTTDCNIIDISNLMPGKLVQVKSTLSNFRSTMQLNLERVSEVRDTNAELQFIDARLQFFVGVLSEPWVLLDEDIRQLQIQALGEDDKALEHRRRVESRAKRKAEREAKDLRHILKRYAREEEKRAKEAAACREDGLRLMADIQRKRGLKK